MSSSPFGTVGLRPSPVRRLEYRERVKLMGKYIEPLQTFVNKLAESYRSGELQPKQTMQFIAVQLMLKIISNPDFLPKAGISHDQAMKSLLRCEEWLENISPKIYELHAK